MTTYAVGDIQGCLDPLRCILDQVNFDPTADTLWVAGDMVNRGPDSLGTLRYLYKLGKAATIVLGNHDLHLLAIYHQQQTSKKGDTLDAILEAPDCDELIRWLSNQALVHHDEKLGFTLVHAGIPPQLNLEQALRLSSEVEAVLQSSKAPEFFKNMYGNEPSAWNEELQGYDRLKGITDYFTRMRFCTADGKLDLINKKATTDSSSGMKPWFQHTNRKMQNQKIIFGHWAALKGQVDLPNLYALDTACVWGEKLTLLRLCDEKLFYCSC